MSIIVTNIRTDYKASAPDVISRALKSIGISKKNTQYCGIFRESLDLRHGNISKISSVEIALSNPIDEAKIAEGNPSVYIKPQAFIPVVTGKNKLHSRPVVVGFGPAGMFAALMLAERGFKPIVLERGSSIENRDKDVKDFFDNRNLNIQSNIQFGEGGAGAYSDGKLTTRINDPLCQLVLDIFKLYGAPDEVIRLAKPHIGTDLLKGIVVSIRKRIEELGGQVLFNTSLIKINTTGDRLKSITTTNGTIDTEVLILAIGHSARDTVKMLFDNGVEISPKAFSVGLRIEHLQSRVNRSVYGKYSELEDLPAGEYSSLSRSPPPNAFMTVMPTPSRWQVS